MPSSVIVASTWSASEAERLARHLRSMGIDSYITTNFDRSTYGGEFGGARVLVDADLRLEAELELVLLGEERPLPALEDTADPYDPAGPTEDDEAQRALHDRVTRRRWVVVAGWLAVGAMAFGAIVPTVRIVMSAAGG